MRARAHAYRSPAAPITRAPSQWQRSGMNGWIRKRFMDEAAMCGQWQRRSRVARLFVAAAGLILLFLSSVAAEEAQWIWSPEHAKESVPAGEACHFRKLM